MVMPTSDAEVVLEAAGPDWWQYRRADGCRWIVRGRCDQRGDCLIGTTIAGVGRLTSHADIARACAQLSVTRLLGPLDVPIGPNYHGGCCPFTIQRLE